MLALIYGGSGSGKSELAEAMLADSAKPGTPLLYVATMYPHGAETNERIARHRAARAHKGFVTVERYTDLAGLTVPRGAHVLLECLGNLAANELFAPDGAGADAEDAMTRGIAMLMERTARTIIVSNDVFSDGVVYPAETEAYRSLLAALNSAIAARSAVVVETVCGIALRHKDDGSWKA